MADINIKYDTWTAMTWSMETPLASDTNLLAGQESTVVDNSSSLFIDYHVGGTFTGPSSGAAAGVIQIFAYGTARGATDYTAECTGTDGTLTLVDETKQLLRLVTVITTNTTNGEIYEWGPFSIAEVFGGVVPQKWGLWGVHDAGGALQAATTAYLGIEYQSA